MKGRRRIIVSGESAPAQQGRNQLFSFLAGPVHLAADAHARLAVSADQHGAGKHPDVPAPRYVTRGVQQDRKAQAGGPRKPGRLLRRLLEVDGQHGEPVAVDLGDLLQRGHFSAARLAPAGPEVDEHAPAAQVRQTPGLAIKVQRLESRRRLPGRPPPRLEICQRATAREQGCGSQQGLAHHCAPCRRWCRHGQSHAWIVSHACY